MITRFFEKYCGLGLIGILLPLILLGAVFCQIKGCNANADVRYSITRPATTLSCTQELSAIRESMFQSSMGEALLAKQLGNDEHFKWFLSRAHYVQHTEDLIPSPATCVFGNLRTLRVMAAGWEYDYLLDEVAVFKMESQ